MRPLFSSDALLACLSDTLELKASKESAHNHYVMSVAFSPDGKTIVSGSADKTIKVWDAGQPFHLSHFLPVSSHLTPLPADSLTLIKEKQDAHTSDWRGSISSVQFSPDGTQIVSGGMADETIKVWDAGQPFHLLPCLLSSPLTPFLLASQILWNSRQPKRAPITTRSCPSPSLRTARRSSLDRMTRRSKCGTQVSRFIFCHLVFLRF